MYNKYIFYYIQDEVLIQGLEKKAWWIFREQIVKKYGSHHHVVNTDLDELNLYVAIFTKGDEFITAWRNKKSKKKYFIDEYRTEESSISDKIF